MKTNLSARRPSVEDRHTRADKILGTSNEHPSAHHEGSLPQRGSGSADATRGAGARVSSGPAGIRSPEGPPSQFMVPKGPHSPPVVHQHATPQTSAVPIQSVHPLPRSISNPVPIEASVTKEKADVDDNIDDDKDGVSVSSSWRRRSSRFGDTPLQDMIPPIVSTPSTFRRPNLTHLHTSDPVETSTIPRAPSPFERQEIVQSTPAMSVRTINGRRESASIATPTARANDVASRKDDTMSKDDAASKRSDVISKADDVASRVGGESAATSAWKKAPLPPSEVGRTSVVGSTQSWSSTVIERVCPFFSPQWLGYFNGQFLSL
ncbi:uncharacterized protein EI90DRAFT_3061057, partial [Cantharellus anzutake]|uniref:uncharacterized protein n=1 Tax=Cantharellus anzutake TaxID=1750568 RepID=UPI0019030B38